MKKIIFPIVVLLFSLNGIAQQTKEKKHKIEIGLNRYHFYNVIPLSPSKYKNLGLFGPYYYVADNFELLNVRYSYSIKPRIALYIQYNRGPTNSTILVIENYTAVRSSIGKMITRNKYNFFDLGSEYKLYRYRKHTLAAAGAISFACGENTYVLGGVWVGSPEHIIATEREEKQELYFGATAGLSYNFTFWKNRMNVGANFTARHYDKGFPFQVNYGARIGYSF